MRQRIKCIKTVETILMDHITRGKKISNYPYSRFDPLMRKWEGMKTELKGFFIKRSQSSAMQITHANHDRLVLNSKHHIRA